MVFTRSQIENLSSEKLIEELLELSDISIQLKALNDWLDTFASKHEELKSNLVITKNSNALVHQQIIQLEWNPAKNVQYHRRKCLEVNLVPREIWDSVLEETVCRVISLTWHEVAPDDLHACHRLKNKSKVIWKLENRKLKR